MMKLRNLSVCLLCGLLAASLAVAETPRKSGLTVLAKYEGGTLRLSQGRVRATIAEDEVIFHHGSQRVAVPLKNITALTCSTDVRRRFGASVLGMVPLMHLDKTELHYVGLTWTGEGAKASKDEMVLRLTSGEYRDFLAVMERLAGIKAINADKVPTVVRYEL